MLTTHFTVFTSNDIIQLDAEIGIQCELRMKSQEKKKFKNNLNKLPRKGMPQPFLNFKQSILSKHKKNRKRLSRYR